MSDFQFQLQAPYKPAGDQPSAIAQITNHFDEWQQLQTLLGATGTGKTFTMAHMIQELQKPTLILSHNKTLAAQLATEFKHFFPHNAVHYFVSYFDYYQPESYMADRDLYIEKEATINQEIEMYRLGALASLVTRPDTIIVASVSSLYGLGDRTEFVKNSLTFRLGLDYNFREIKEKLLAMQYQPVQSKIEQGMFDIQGETIDIYSSVEKKLYRLVFDENTLEYIITKDPISFADQGTIEQVTIWPSSQYLQDMTNQEAILSAIMNEKNTRVAELEKADKILEANRLNKRVEYDIRMIRETWFTNGIENYSLYFDGRTPGQAPNTLFDYFPDDMLTVVDESHMTIPQLRAMPQADKSRKLSLVDNGFRLPSALDHRPLNFRELEAILWRAPHNQATAQLYTDSTDYFRPRLEHTTPQMMTDHKEFIATKYKPWAKTLFVSATPASYEIDHSKSVVQQIIRPTGLLDPITYVYPKSGDYQTLRQSIDMLLEKKPHLATYFDGYEEDLVTFE